MAAQEKGKRVLILDMDPQGTATAWFKDRESESPTLATIKSSELTDAIRKAKKAGFDLIFIDTPGRDEPSTAAAIAGTTNYKRKYDPDFPTVKSIDATPGRIATAAAIESCGILAQREPPPP